MNSALSIERIPYQLLENLHSLLVFALFIGSFIIFATVFKNTSPVFAFVIFAILFISAVLLSFYLDGKVNNFKQAQISWLVKRGTKINGSFKKIRSDIFSSSYMGIALYVEVVGQITNESKQTSFKSPILYRGDYTFFANPKVLLRKAVEEHISQFGGIDVYVNPSNPKVYWVDISWCRLRNPTTKETVLERAIVVVIYLAILGFIFLSAHLKGLR